MTNGNYDANGTLIGDTPSGSDRGFTGHEHLDDVGIIHMNGRLYDPHTGRFIQPDPHIQAPEHLQSFNRYSYVLNNPLNATDPTGEFWLEFAAALAATWFIADRRPELRPFLAIAWSIALAPGAGFVNMNIGLIGQSAVAGFVSGSVASGNLKGGVQGAFSAALFAGIGQGIGDVSWADPGKMLGAMSAHALAGCVTSAVSGGDCGSGAASAAFSKAAAPFLPDAKAAMGEKALGAVTSAIIGGTASHLSGGKFANGAVTGAFSYLFNALSQEKGAQGEKLTMDEMKKRIASDPDRYVLTGKLEIQMQGINESGQRWQITRELDNSLFDLKNRTFHMIEAKLDGGKYTYGQRIELQGRITNIQFPVIPDVRVDHLAGRWLSESGFKLGQGALFTNVDSRAWRSRLTEQAVRDGRVVKYPIPGRGAAPAP